MLTVLISVVAIVKTNVRSPHSAFERGQIGITIFQINVDCLLDWPAKTHRHARARTHTCTQHTHMRTRVTMADGIRHGTERYRTGFWIKPGPSFHYGRREVDFGCRG